jgi:hypothetical protein
MMSKRALGLIFCSAAMAATFCFSSLTMIPAFPHEFPGFLRIKPGFPVKRCQSRQLGVAIGRGDDILAIVIRHGRSHPLVINDFLEEMFFHRH